MQAPQTYPRRILLAVTGLSPQVVTETLYALAVPSKLTFDPAQTENARQAFLPTEIHLLTTAQGAKLARTALLHPDGGQFHALLADYPQLGRPRFDESTIHIIHGPTSEPLADIRTPQENAAAADAITACMAELTRDETAALHVSIAGGRKTMGFYLGYAFSLFARPQDKLSHVLVSSPFENHPDFFFPPATPHRLATAQGHHIDTADALITLAEIPVVRLRHGLPQALAEGQASFIETVAALQESFAPPKLCIDLASRRVTCGGRSVMLKPALLAWLAYWASSALEGRPLQNWREADPERFLRLYARIVGVDAEVLHGARRRLKDGMEKEFFEQNNSKLEAALKAALGPAAAPYLLIREGRRPHLRRGLNLPIEAIELR